MINEWIYNKDGETKIYLEEDKFMAKSGEQIGSLENEDVFTVNGEYIGAFVNGVLYDSDNRPVAFTERAKDYIPSGADITGSDGMEDTAFVPEGLGFSGVAYNPISGGWSDITVEELFGVEL